MLATPNARAQSLKTARLLPGNTAVLLWVPDAPDTARRFMNTGLGRMSRDPQVRPLVDQFFASLSASLESDEGGIGLSLSELRSLFRGEMTLAVVAPPEGGPVFLALADTGDRAANAQRLLDRISRGTGRSELNVFDTRIVVHEPAEPGEQPMMFLEKEGTVVVATSMDVLKQVLAAWNGQEVATLGGNQKFGAIMRRSREENPRPQFVWYVDPIMLLRSMGQKNAGIQMGLAMLPALGLDGVRALGGGVEWDAGAFDSVVHMHLLLDSPRAGVLKMLALKTGDMTPERWVPADVSTYTTMHWDVQTAFDSLKETFDSFRGEGALSDAVWKWIGEPTGLDFENDLLPALTGRVTRITRRERSGVPKGNASLVAFELEKDAKVGPLLEGILATGGARFSRRSFSTYEYFQWASPGPDGEDLPRRSTPQPFFGVLDDYLVVANQESLYQTVIATADGSTGRLADALEFKLVADKIRARGGDAEPAMIRFARPEERMRATYDLAAADQARRVLKGQAERSSLSRALNSALEGGPLPPFAVLERYLAPGGGVLTVDEEGLHYTGITLRRE